MCVRGWGGKVVNRTIGAVRAVWGAVTVYDDVAGFIARHCKDPRANCLVVDGVEEKVRGHVRRVPRPFDA